MNALVRSRTFAFRQQRECCFYCGMPMWQSDKRGFAKRHGLSDKQAARLQCTAEHLTARCEGGGNGTGNIVAACLYCNRHRHMAANPLPPDRYKARVRNRVSRGRWHGLSIKHGRQRYPATP